MPGLSESFWANKSFTLVAAALAFFAAAVLLSVIFRFTFGRRIRLPRNGRARLPRLGTVDAFDLDRQRQLVIIRRDNVEHLLMIGGPNDLVIESQIIRAESRDPRDIREARIRDKELREKEPKDAPPLPAGVVWPSPAEAPVPNPPRRKMLIPAELEPETGVAPCVPIRGANAGVRAFHRFANSPVARALAGKTRFFAACSFRFWPKNTKSTRASSRPRGSFAEA
jgi:flagellar protein FliO/FliZ